MENKAFNPVPVWMRQSLTRWLVFASPCLVSCLVAFMNQTLGNVADGNSICNFSGIWHLRIGDLGKELLLVNFLPTVVHYLPRAKIR